MNNSKCILILCVVLVVLCFKSRAQLVQPINAELYNVETRFHQAFGTIGSDGSGNDPDPSWIVKTASDANNAPNSLLNNNPSAVNTGSYCYVITTSNNNWHPVQDALIDNITNNTTGAFDYEVMSFENDYSNRCIYHADGSGPINDDDNMNYKEGIISFKNRTIGVYHQAEIDVSAPVVRSKVRLRYAWRPAHGTRTSPLDFGLLSNDCNTYYHSNGTLVANVSNNDITYLNEWSSSDHNSFTDANDVTYSFEYSTQKRMNISANFNFDGAMNLVSLDALGNFASYISNDAGTGEISEVLPAGKYALVIEGNNVAAMGSFNFTFNIETWAASRQVPSAFPDGVIYVNDNATGNQSGASWSNAIKDLQFAIQYADKNTPIWVAKGNYYPTFCNDITASFHIPDSVKIYGNFEGNEPASFNTEDRDFKTLETYLQGSLLVGGNVYHVVNTKNVSSETLLDGFVIINGSATGTTNITKWGAGWLNEGNGAGNKSTPTVRNCHFTGNEADKGAAFYDYGEDGEASSIIEKCIFENNTATTHGGAYYGNGIDGESSANISNTVFKNNLAFAGGAVYITSPNGLSKGTWTSNLFQNHDIDGPGAAAVLHGVSELTVYNTIFYNNDNYHIWYDPTNTDTHPTFFNCNFVGADQFALTYNTNMVTPTTNNKLTFINTIFRENNGNISGSANEGLDLSYCIVEESFFNNINSNIQVNPNFIQSGINFGLRAGSPARNAGTQTGLSLPSTDFSGRNRVFDGQVDIGAHEAINKIYVGLESNVSNGESWETAQANLAHALLEGSEVWVKKGIYNSNVTYQIPDSTLLYGSFEGNEPDNYDLSQRNYVLNETILDGNIGDPADSTDNQSTIINFLNGSGHSVIDGFTIKNCYATNFSDGALYITMGFNLNMNLTISHCSFKNNSGGAILNRAISDVGSLTVTDCFFENNDAEYGGAINLREFNNSITKKFRKVDVNIQSCTFKNNRAVLEGGAIYSFTDTSNYSFNITDCEFLNNSSGYRGGALFLKNFEGIVNSTISNCSFTTNHTNSFGGAVYATSTSGLTDFKIENSVLNSNESPTAAGIFMSSFSSPGVDSASSLEVINCKILDNTSIPTGEGAGIYLNSLDSLFSSSVINTVFAGNTPSHLHTLRRNDAFKENKFVNCTFQGASEGVLNFGSSNGTSPPSSDFLNCIFWDNNADMVIGSSNYDQLINVEYSIVEEASFAPANNNIFQNPLFQNSSSGNFNIQSASTAKNTGNSAFNGTSLTLDNTSRVIQNQIDRGAYEFGDRIYVNKSSTGLNTGSTWEDAYVDLQVALPQKGEIWVAEGNYLPTDSNDRTVSFVLSDSTQLYGGFAGNEPFDFNIDDRNLNLRETVLSGNIGSISNSFDNSYHVVDVTNNSENTLIDGFTIVGGRADGATGFNTGGGVWYSYEGSGISKTIFKNVLIEDNYGLLGGGLGFLVSNGTMKADIENSVLDDNLATAGGAGFLNSFSGLMEVSISTSKIQNNRGQFNAGGFYNFNAGSGDLSFSEENCLFSNNSTSSLGGAILNLSNPGNTLTFTSKNSTYVDNKAKNGGAIYASLANDASSSQVIDNSIFWNNIASISGNAFYQKDASLSISHSLVKETSCVSLDQGENLHSINCGAGMIYNQDPLFIDEVNQVFHLDCGSPAINQGTSVGAPGADINGFLRTGNPDLGAYEFGYQQFEEAVTSGTNPSITGLPFFLLKQRILNTNNSFYQAANAIELKPGFEVSPSVGQASVFRAEIGGACP